MVVETITIGETRLVCNVVNLEATPMSRQAGQAFCSVRSGRTVYAVLEEATRHLSSFRSAPVASVSHARSPHEHTSLHLHATTPQSESDKKR